MVAGHGIGTFANTLEGGGLIERGGLNNSTKYRWCDSQFLSIINLPPQGVLPYSLGGSVPQG